MTTLELFDERHLGGMDALLSDPAVLRFTRVPVPVPDGFARRWFAGYEEARLTASRELFAIVDSSGAEFLGLAMAPRIDHEERTAELGYIVAPAARGRGVATAALGLLTEWAFDRLDALRLELLISVENAASQRVAARCGYTREGVLRSLYIKQGLRADTEIWSRLPSDAKPSTAAGELRTRS
jgi:RimJ/RimL family protein N-acetyltransferase